MLRPLAESKPFSDGHVSASALEIFHWLTQEGFSGFQAIPDRGDEITLVALGRENPDFTAPAPVTNYEVLERQFFEDDIATMAELGVLRRTFNGRGESLYHLTRAGAEVAKATAPPAAR